MKIFAGQKTMWQLVTHWNYSIIANCRPEITVIFRGDVWNCLLHFELFIYSTISRRNSSEPNTRVWDTPLQISHKASGHTAADKPQTVLPPCGQFFIHGSFCYTRRRVAWHNSSVIEPSSTAVALCTVRPAQTLQTRHFVLTFFTRFPQQSMVIPFGICNRTGEFYCDVDTEVLYIVWVYFRR
jgi:hypothetical protein